MFNNLVMLVCLGDSQWLNFIRVLSGAFFQLRIKYELCGKGGQKWLFSRHDLTNCDVIGHFHSDSLIGQCPEKNLSQYLWVKNAFCFY